MSLIDPAEIKEQNALMAKLLGQIEEMTLEEGQQQTEDPQSSHAYF